MSFLTFSSGKLAGEADDWLGWEGVDALTCVGEEDLPPELDPATAAIEKHKKDIDNLLFIP